ncbi:hypothetical protein JOB18_015542 [Solea senegalensis]|uniref:Uncharacterized protein n=1 Tax=Solea senegalensis TaxID=28829 RepID=A0AAV6ST03_SOLSE|nr:hypothetical protein JOB18_015542 [Solea senegalensis]
MDKHNVHSSKKAVQTVSVGSSPEWRLASSCASGHSSANKQDAAKVIRRQYACEVGVFSRAVSGDVPWATCGKMIDWERDLVSKFRFHAFDVVEFNQQNTPEMEINDEWK